MKYIVTIIILSFFLLGCKKDDDSSSTTTTELEGTWVVSCAAASGNYYLKKSFVIAGTNLTENYDYFSDSSCTTAESKWETNHVSLTLGDAMTFSTYGTSGGSGYRFTTKISTNNYTPQSSSEVSWANTNSWCGLTNWELNVGQDIAGKTCGSSTYWSSGITVYGLYILDGNKFMPAFNKDTYPSSVSSADSNIFIKQ